MSFLKELKPKKVEIKPIVKQSVKQKDIIVKQIPSPKKDKPLKLNPNVKSLADIPNTNIMTIGNLLGIRLRAKKKIMLKQLIKHIEGKLLISGEKNAEKN